MIVAAIVIAMGVSIFGMLIHIVMEGAKKQAIAQTKLAIEQDAAEKLRKANEIITTHSDPDDAERSLRDGSF